MATTSHGSDGTMELEPLVGRVIEPVLPLNPGVESGPVSAEADMVRLFHYFSQLPKRMQTQEASMFDRVVAEDALSLKETGVSHEEIARTLGELFFHTQERLKAGDCERLTQVDWSPSNVGGLIDLGSRLDVFRFAGEEEREYRLLVTVGVKGKHTVTDSRDGSSIALFPAQVPLIGKCGFYGGNANRATPLMVARVLEIGDNKSDVPSGDPVRQMLLAHTKGKGCNAVITTAEQLTRRRAVDSVLGAGHIKVKPTSKAQWHAMQRITDANASLPRGWECTER